VQREISYDCRAEEREGAAWEWRRHSPGFETHEGGRLVHAQDLPAALAADLDGNFEQLVSAYQDRLYAFALRLTGSPEDAEEIAQDAFVHAYQALVTYPAQRISELVLRPWLYQIALNVFRNRRRRRPLQLVSLGEAGDGMGVDLEDDKAERPDAALEHAELRDRLGALVAALPERYRLAVVLRHVQGLRYAEIAALLRQPVGTVKANVHRALRLLRDGLEKQEGTEQARHRAKAHRG
jgi:RNA polymerase sigma-70 factor (ECF subfamily)